MNPKIFRIIPEGQSDTKRLDVIEFQQKIFELFPEKEATRICNRTLFESAFQVESNGVKYNIVRD